MLGARLCTAFCSSYSTASSEITLPSTAQAIRMPHALFPPAPGKRAPLARPASVVLLLMVAMPAVPIPPPPPLLLRHHCSKRPPLLARSSGFPEPFVSLPETSSLNPLFHLLFAASLSAARCLSAAFQLQGAASLAPAWAPANGGWLAVLLDCSRVCCCHVDEPFSQSLTHVTHATFSCLRFPSCFMFLLPRPVRERT